MIKVEHRINDSQVLQKVSKQHGVELDIRAEGQKLILAHDAFVGGEDFEEHLNYYEHQLLILNTKCEGLEERLFQLMGQRGIEDYFLLDVSLPFLVRYAKLGFRKMAIRFSEYEPIEFTMGFAGLVDWVWVDCFSAWPLNQENYQRLKPHFKICLVSPELQGHDVSCIPEWRSQIVGMEIDAVCTKRPDLWA